MNSDRAKRKFKEWLRRYVIAELLGTAVAVCFAYITFLHTHSYVKAAAAGFVGEGIGFYGYFVASELLQSGKAYAGLPLLRRLGAIIAKSSTNLIIEFAPAEIVDNVFVRPFLMFYAPQHIKPYALGFIAGKLSADAMFYIFAISGYEVKQRLAAKKRLAGSS